ncbi:hypothetical protein HWV62_12831 [Athelia sp. TMB]|nr:hypothetical protein HWV62_12831 [Athelia sp. TMB]
MALRTTAPSRIIVGRSVGSHGGGKHSLRSYHDESFGFRKARAYELPDYTPAQLQNRVANAPLLRYADSLRTHGHRAARVDPLDILQREEVAALDPARYGLVDPDQKYDVNGIVWTQPIDSDFGAPPADGLWTLGDITRHLRAIYTGRVAYEYMHSPSKKERLWFSHLLESQTTVARKHSAGEKKRIHSLLARSETFDNFLQLKFPNLKRYGLEGGESMLPALDALFNIASKSGIQHVILGMPHRGRLNLLTELLEYSPTALFHKIKGGFEIPEDLGAEGDVISHLVASPSLIYEGASGPIKVSLLPNPSHLEAVNPVAMGKARAKQFSLLKNSPDDCTLGDRVMCVQLHGDGSFTGQGVVMEGLGLSNLPHFTSGGSVHIVVNIGYTTPASSARSSLYCSDIGKMINAPILHVNGDHPEDVARAVETAFKYRNYFRKDIIVDLIVYRRWGHNELDEPAFTQPRMYEKIRSRKSVPQLYEDKLISDDVIARDEAASLRSSYKARLDSHLGEIASYTPSASMLADQWSGMVWPASTEANPSPKTGVDRQLLEKVGKASVTVPEGFEIHPRLQRHVKHRLQSIEQDKGLDWATAEAMAFGTLMLEGNDVRISGQDVGRGTFSHRHAMLVDQHSESVHVPLNSELGSDGKLELANSSLSEMAVMGFEYGQSWERPNLLPIWEAQFGDFFNGAQVIIDTFITSAETKWLKQSAIVLSLPHGLDGAGPEHSSSRIERMLQLSNDRYSAEDGDKYANVNIHVTFPTTPAQNFHLLRRQLTRNFRKPLVIAAPKGLLRLPAASSRLADIELGTSFQPVLADPIARAETAERVVLLSGKIYYDLIKEREALGLVDRVAFVRVEELSPFPFEELAQTLKTYSNAKEFFWLQEEPKNQGAWTHVSSRLDTVLAGLGHEGGVVYRGRKQAAMPAPGIARIYGVQQKQVLASAFEGL